jgi:hypothetical protein
MTVTVPDSSQPTLRGDSSRFRKGVEARRASHEEAFEVTVKDRRAAEFLYFCFAIAAAFNLASPRFGLHRPGEKDIMPAHT